VWGATASARIACACSCEEVRCRCTLTVLQLLHWRVRPPASRTRVLSADSARYSGVRRAHVTATFTYAYAPSLCAGCRSSNRHLGTRQRSFASTQPRSGYSAWDQSRPPNIRPTLPGSINGMVRFGQGAREATVPDMCLADTRECPIYLRLCRTFTWQYLQQCVSASIKGPASNQ
jgi:hypothetical protein